MDDNSPIEVGVSAKGKAEVESLDRAINNLRLKIEALAKTSLTAASSSTTFSKASETLRKSLSDLQNLQMGRESSVDKLNNSITKLKTSLQQLKGTDGHTALQSSLSKIQTTLRNFENTGTASVDSIARLYTRLDTQLGNVGKVIANADIASGSRKFNMFVNIAKLVESGAKEVVAKVKTEAASIESAMDVAKVRLLETQRQMTQKLGKVEVAGAYSPFNAKAKFAELGSTSQEGAYSSYNAQAAYVKQQKELTAILEAASLSRIKIAGAEAQTIMKYQQASGSVSWLAGQSAAQDRATSDMLGAQRKADSMFVQAAAKREAELTAIAKAGSMARIAEVARASKIMLGNVTVTGDMSSISGSTLGKTYTYAGEEAKKASPHLMSFNSHLKDGHSFARGMASGFNAMWLTWGNLVPLLAGAAISNSFMLMAKTGMQVAHTMEVIAVLGGNTREEMVMLGEEMSRLGRNGPFGPLEIADAMKTLSLAGLKANEILAVTGTVLNFSIAGTTDLKMAADTLVSVSTAFHMGADGFTRISDVISKAAAESKSSVESFSNAMKTASVVSAQYGVSLVDTATEIAVLSQLGIEGTSAGTAIRNMYADLSGRSKQVTAALKSMGLEMRDNSGNFKPMLTVVAELKDKLDNLDSGIKKKNFLQTLLSERGAKGMVELLHLIETSAKDAGKGMAHALEELRYAIEQSYGFSAISAAKLSMTVESQFKAVRATMLTNLNEGYQDISPVLMLIADELKQTFNNPEVMASLKGLWMGIGQLALTTIQIGEVLVTHLGLVAAAVVAYKLLAYTAGTLALKQAEVAVATRLGTAATDAGTTAALANNTVKMTGLVALARWLPGVGTAITIVAGMWELYSFWVSSAADNEAKANDLYNTGTLARLKSENDKLEAINALRAEGLTKSQAQAQFDAEQDKKTQLNPMYKEYVTATQEVMRLQAMKEKTKGFNAPSTFVDPVDIQLSKATELQQKKLSAIEATNAAMALQTQRAIDQHKVEAAYDEYQKKEPVIKTGDLTFGGARPTKAVGYSLVSDQSTENMRKGYAQNLKALQDAQTEEKKLLDAKRAARLLDDGQFFVLDLQMQQKAEKAQLDSQAKFLAEESLAYERDVDKIVNDFVTRDLKAQGKPNYMEWYEGAIDKVAAGLEDLDSKHSNTVDEIVNAEKKIRRNVATRLELDMITARGAIADTKRASEDFTLADVANTEKVARAVELENAVRMARPDEAARLTAESSALEAVNAELAKQDIVIRRTADTLRAVASAEDQSNSEIIQAKELLTEKLVGELDLMRLIRDVGIDNAKITGDNAKNRISADAVEAITKSTADAITSGILDGGEAAVTKLRAIIDAELRKEITFSVTALVRPVMQSISGALGLGSSASAGQSGSVGDAMGAVSAYDKFVSGFSSTAASMKDIGGTLSSTFGKGASALINNGFDKAGNALADVAKSANNYSGYINTASDILGYATAVSSLANGKIATAAGQALGTYFGGALGAFVGGKIGGALDSLFGGETRSGATYDTVNGVAHYQQGPSGGEIAGTQARAMFDATQSTIKATLLAFGSKASLTGYTAGLESSANGKGFEFAGGYINGTGFGESGGRDGGQFAYHSQDSQQAFTDYGTQLAQSIIEALQATPDIPKTITDIINQTLGGAAVSSLTADDTTKLLETLNAVAGTVNAFGVAVQELPFDTLKNLSFDTASGLIAAAGGMEKLGTNLGSYYTNFYSSEEQRLQTIKTINAATAGSGLDAATATRKSFRELVESYSTPAKLMTEEGQKMYTSLLSVAGAFASITPELSAVAGATDSVGTSISELLKSLQSAGVDLADQYDKLTMSQADYRNKTIKNYTDQEKLQARANFDMEDKIAEYTAAEAVKVANQALTDQYNVLTGAITANDLALSKITDSTTKDLTIKLQAAQKTKDIETERKGLQDQYDQLTMTSAQLLDKQRNALDASNQALFNNIQAINAQAVAVTTNATLRGNTLASYSTAATDAYATLQRAVAAQQASDAAAYETQKAIATAAFTSQQTIFQNSIDATGLSIDAANKSLSKLQNLSSSLKSTLDSMKIAGSEGVLRAAAQAQIKNALNKAKSGGGLPLEGELTNALTAVSQPSEQLYLSFEDYAKDFYSTANDIADLNDLTSTQLVSQETTLSTLQEQLKAINEQKSQLKDSFAAQISTLDGLLTGAQMQLDATNGINVSVLSVVDALAAFNTSIRDLANTRAYQGLATDKNNAEANAIALQRKNTIKTYIDDTFNNSSLNNIQKAQSIYNAAKLNGVTEAEIASAYGSSASDVRGFFETAGIPQFDKGGDHTGGLRFVGESGVELEATGASRIWNAKQTREMLQGPSDNGVELAKALREMADRLDKIEANTNRTAENTTKFTKQFDTATEGGRAMQTEAYT